MLDFWSAACAKRLERSIQDDDQVGTAARISKLSLTASEAGDAYTCGLIAIVRVGVDGSRRIGKERFGRGL